MTYKSDDYSKLDRNHTRARSALNWIDSAREFQRLKYVERASIVATDKDGNRIEIALSANLKNTIVIAGTEHCVNAAKTINAERFEEVDFEAAAKV